MFCILTYIPTTVVAYFLARQYLINNELDADWVIVISVFTPILNLYGAIPTFIAMLVFDFTESSNGERNICNKIFRL